jgi:predicted transglutaminase-like cysteine proteinase
VNNTIAPATDLEIYGVNEYWTLPRTKGDCEDYALLKRHNLIKKGWPVSSLLMTVVRDEKGEGHAVLTARTMQGDFILDNKIEEVRLWSQTPYEYVMRQSYINPRVWVALDTRQSPLATSLSGLELDQ